MSHPQPAYQHHIRRYFHSGWAFLMPYLLMYLLYYLAKWPVNAAASAASGNGSEVIGNGPITHNPSPIPCLLHVYWALHSIHAILAGFALWAWWKETKSLQEAAEQTEDTNAQSPLTQRTPVQTNLRTPTSGIRPLASGFSSIALRLLPWLLLALLFYIPGVYLEWPSDPWEHLRRINEWRILDTVGAHSSWMKSSYFIPYSFLCWCIGLRQLFWLDFYYTGICLLLCWQYYRFSRACGLGERSSMVFVIIQALLFGNNIFSFYRYYGISSSIYAQLGAVALTRVVLQFAARGTKLGTILQEETERTETGSSSTPLPQLSSAQTNAENTILQKVTKLTKDEDIPLAHESGNARPLNVQRSAFSFERSTIADLHPSSIPPLTPYPLSLKPQILPLITAVTCLLALTALNHPQGIGIAGLGVVAIIIWRLIEWKRSARWWLIGGMIVINALFLWIYPRPAIIETYRAQGWLNTWYGFNILDLTSPSGDRMLQILSVFGLIGLGCTTLLFRRNHVTAWLTAFPLFAILLPCFAVPFAIVTNKAGGESNIVTFQRLLFSIPICLVFAAQYSLIPHYRNRPASDTQESIPRAAASAFRIHRIFAAVAFISTIVLTVIPNERSSYNRIWHACATLPQDVKLPAIARALKITEHAGNPAQGDRIISHSAGYAIISNFTGQPSWASARSIGTPTIGTIKRTIELLSTYSQSQEATASTSPPCVSSLVPSHTGQRGTIFAISGNDPAAWTVLGGNPPDFIQVPGQHPGTPLTVLQNPEGKASHVFTSSLVPVNLHHNYYLETYVRGSRAGGTMVYLAVAWYDRNGHLLESHTAKPWGAGAPLGWHNGTYSYYGLAGTPPPGEWQRFGISFGFAEDATIPENAMFVRLGALLNYNKAKSSFTQLSKICLYNKPIPYLYVLVSSPTSLFSYASQAAQLSKHWPTQQFITDCAGTREIDAAVKPVHSELLLH